MGTLGRLLMEEKDADCKSPWLVSEFSFELGGRWDIMVCSSTLWEILEVDRQEMGKLSQVFSLMEREIFIEFIFLLCKKSFKGKGVEKDWRTRIVIQEVDYICRH